MDEKELPLVVTANLSDKILINRRGHADYIVSISDLGASIGNYLRSLDFVSISPSALNPDDFVKRAGDTMTGDLVVQTKITSTDSEVTGLAEISSMKFSGTAQVLDEVIIGTGIGIPNNNKVVTLGWLNENAGGGGGDCTGYLRLDGTVPMTGILKFASSGIKFDGVSVTMTGFTNIIGSGDTILTQKSYVDTRFLKLDGTNSMSGILNTPGVVATGAITGATATFTGNIESTAGDVISAGKLISAELQIASGTLINTIETASGTANNVLLTKSALDARYQLAGGAGTAFIPKYYIHGMKVTWETDRSFSIDTGECTDVTSSALFTIDSSPLIKSLEAWAEGAGNGGTPSGVTLTDDKWFKVFLIFKPDGTVDGGIDDSGVAANLLAAAFSQGYTKYRRVGDIYITEAPADYHVKRMSTTYEGTHVLSKLDYFDIRGTNGEENIFKNIDYFSPDNATVDFIVSAWGFARYPFTDPLVIKSKRAPPNRKALISGYPNIASSDTGFSFLAGQVGDLLYTKMHIGPYNDTTIPALGLNLPVWTGQQVPVSAMGAIVGGHYIDFSNNTGESFSSKRVAVLDNTGDYTAQFAFFRDTTGSNIVVRLVVHTEGWVDDRHDTT